MDSVLDDNVNYNFSTVGCESAFCSNVDSKTLIHYQQSRQQARTTDRSNDGNNLLAQCEIPKTKTETKKQVYW